MDGSIIVTYRCNAACHMCNVWKFPTRVEEEIKPEILEKLPNLNFCNITGGEPFLREDILDIIDVVKRKAKRVVISTNGYLTDDILRVARKHKDIGIRVSIEGLPAVNDKLRGLRDGFDHGLRTLLDLQRMGLKDIGFGITVSDKNAGDMLELYQLAKSMDLEFATAVVHNSYYFHKFDNKITNTGEVIGCFEKLIEDLLKSGKTKNWFRAYFNHGLINNIKGNKRLLPCQAGTENFFLDPFGEVKPCNGLEEKYWVDSFGNLNEKSFAEIWNGPKAREIRDKVKNCQKNCWMIGTVSPVMKKQLWVPSLWVLKNKLLGYKGGMRIAVLGTRGFPGVQGGVERHCEELYTRLAKLGCGIRVYARKGYVNPGDKKHKGVEIFPLWAPRVKSFEAIFHTLWGVIRATFSRQRFDIIHIHAIGPSLLTPLAKILGKRVVITNHGPDYDRQKWGKFATGSLRLGEWLGTKLADRVIAVSKVISQRLEKRFCRQIDYVPNGVNIPKRLKPGIYLDNLNITPGKYILAVGRFVPEKGFHDLLQAFKNLKTDWQLVIAGDSDHEDSYSRNLKKLAGADNRVVLTGMINGSRLKEVYSNAGLFVLPSYHEGLPIVLLEALSYNLKILCSSIPANTEIIDDKESIFRAGDINALSERLEYFITNHTQSAISPSSVPDILQEYDWDKIATSVMKIYEDLINGVPDGQVNHEDKIGVDELLKKFGTSNGVEHLNDQRNEKYERISKT